MRAGAGAGAGAEADGGSGGFGGERALSPVPAWHPERVVPFSELPRAEQRWWRNLERRLR